MSHGDYCFDTGVQTLNEFIVNLVLLFWQWMKANLDGEPLLGFSNALRKD